jgi:hypothetical protein
MIGRVVTAVEGVEQDSGSDDPSYAKAKEAGIENERSPEVTEVKE